MVTENDVKRFVIAVRVLSRRSDNYNSASQKSHTKLVIQMQHALKNQNNRKYVISAITGLPITSQKELTQASVSALIDQTLEGSSDNIIKQIEETIEKKFIEDPIGFFPWNLFPWERE